ncbi:MAG: DUF6236 family protein, partial [Deltaproteobacteria bacterium]|nr:DUF6236 family protein [Deltaproteobacteria bacterium]
MDKRGVVINPSVGTERKYTNYIYSFDPVYLRQLVLFFDIIDCPNGRDIGVPLNDNKDDLDLLASEGIFTRTTGVFFSKEPDSNVLLQVHFDNPVAFWSIAQYYAFYKHSLYDDQTQWSLSQPRKYLYLPTKDLLSKFYFVDSGKLYPQQKGNVATLHGIEFHNSISDVAEARAIEVDFQQSLTFPVGNTPMEKILEFKNKRNDECLSFRHAMDEFYLYILNSGDIPRAKTVVVEKIDRALKEINRVMKESFHKRFLGSFKTQYDFNNIYNGIIKGGAIGYYLGLPEVGAVLGGVLSGIKITGLPLLKPKI